ncbi:flagellin N-terminal helical domain-containing protein [Psychromonas algicola]|uniref:flagellin N-terminal helical domain-containing protein n=1 Tax=Psychromonas algicola TaxID=2555642 RepID=UPI0010673251|nr:flagellin [Psychromonas sp. RZ5]TEW46006.1 flagellin [Psychromonas sp. RZ5]
MAQVINTNIMSLNSQRQLSKSQSVQNEAMERLSSGLRINSAKDDAAGLAISTAMQSQIRGINQAVRNSNDGISMSQTAEGSMDEMTNILQRMRELAVQAANDTNSAGNKASIQQEVNQLYDELDRIAGTTQFNGLNLLDGSNGSTTLQIGANAGQTLTFAVDSVTTATLGLDGGVNKGDLNGGRVTSSGLPAGSVSINGIDISTIEVGEGALAMERAINVETALTGVVADAYNVVKGKAFDATGRALTGITTGLQFSVGEEDPITLGATSSMENLAESINRDVPGLTAVVGEEGGLILSNDTGLAITVAGANVADAGLTATTYEGYLGLTSQVDSPVKIGAGSKGVEADTKTIGFMLTNGSAVTGEAISGFAIEETDAITINGVELELSATETLEDKIFAINRLTEETGVVASEGAAEGTILFSNPNGGDILIASDADTEDLKMAALAKLGVIDIGGTTVNELGLGVATTKTAVRSLNKIDNALQQISATRASLGAIQNRLGSTISNLENVSQNLSASNSRIQDADFAAETSKLSKAQILQQAGTSMLTQANASTQNVLSLLQG